MKRWNAGSLARLGLGLALVLSTVVPAAAQQAHVVTDELLRNPPPEEWLTYGRDYAETHYSPLDQIDSGNVGRLGLAWSFELEGSERDAVSGLYRVEATPLVSNGTMYFTGLYSIVYAIDARTGELKWKWDPSLVRVATRTGRDVGGQSICCGPVNRGVALYSGKVYVGLLDGRLVALDAETGERVWVAQTTPVGTDYSVTGAPRIVNGKVIIGNGGAEYGVRGYVSAYDAETGEMVWRFYTVPGDPSLPFESPAMEMAAQTWTGEWWKLGGGGTAWDGMAFDPEANLLYIGTGNGSPWAQDYRSPGGGDNLFLNCIIALNPDTGELVWYYQETPGDNWDYTAVQPLQLADITIDGQVRKVVMHAPKNGFFYVVDRLTGELISAEPYARVTWASHVDLESGRPVETPEARYDSTGTWLAPATSGAHNWHPMSYNPSTGLVYLPGRNNQSFFRINPNFEIAEGRFNTGTGGAGRPEEPPTPDVPAGFLVAWDPVQQQERWRIPLPTRENAGTLTTAGNLVFSGREDGWFYAHDATTGEKLWESEIPARPASSITYMLDGRQYITIMAGPASQDGPPAQVLTYVLDGNAPLPRTR